MIGNIPECIAFSGPRPKELYGYKDKQSYRNLMQALQDICHKLADADCTTFTSGGAQGTDQIAFWAVEHVKKSHPHVQNRVAITENQCSRWPSATLFGQEDYRKMVGRADEVEMLTYADTGAQSAGHLLNMRNETMLDAAEALIAVFPRAQSVFNTQGSGTANCIKSALRRKMPIILMDPTTLEIYRDDIGLDSLSHIHKMKTAAAKPEPEAIDDTQTNIPQPVISWDEKLALIEDDPYNDYGNDAEVTFSAPWL